jgi:ribosomal protein S18 acetylase RimI-like enzyme
MIKKLDNTDVYIAKQIYTVFQNSYKIEAELLRATDFPPLKRSVKNFTKSTTKFFGYFKDNQLAAVIELIIKPEYIHIRSLVVEPIFFKQGIASELIKFTFKKFDSILYIVETGQKNYPAIKLYEKHGFKLVKEWLTDINIIKVKLEKTNY